MKPLLFFSACALTLGMWAGPVFYTPAAERNGGSLTVEKTAYGTRGPGENGFEQAARRHNKGGRQPSLKQMIGQMLLVGFAGTKSSQPHPQVIQRQIAQGEIGGVIFMSWNVGSRKQVRQLTSLFAASAPALPPLIGVDQEGGRVQRLEPRKGYRRYPSAKSVGLRMTYDDALAIYRAMALELRENGFNLNFGPVIDLEINRRNPIIGRKMRSFGDNPFFVSAFADAFITAHREAGVLTSIKHFPGHGSSHTDSHRQFVDLSGRWKEAEMTPYESLIEARMVDTVMVGHLYHPEFAGPEKVPASLSARAVGEVLRGKMGFEGVVITDDLEMGAVAQNYSFAESLLKAIEAGNDILLLSNRIKPDIELPQRAAKIIADAVVSGRIPSARIKRSYERIVRLKRSLLRPGTTHDAQLPPVEYSASHN